MNNVSAENGPDESMLAEERKRERNWDPAKRWRAIQDTIAWADLQAQHPRNSSHACLQAQGFQTQ
ncbi:MAG: hypothetical protein O2931_06370 [Planctomycetota bacterium]|nr:hypothetical protein [Planctomycetota bacterium]MDA1178406.1 hypothetical protein [Planctomycetota bacterium]